MFFCFNWFEEHQIYLQDIKPIHIQDYLDEKKKTLSICTLKKHKAYISATLKYCRLLELIKFNPLENVQLGKQKGSKFVADWYDSDEMAAALKLAEKIDEPIFPNIYLSGIKGMRREECCAASWSNVNWKRKTLKIDETNVRENGTYQIVDSTKTDTSHRELPLSDKDIAFLKKIKKRQEVNKKMFGDSYDYTHEDYICVWPDGKLISPDVCTRRWALFIERNGLKKIRFQDLRASAATNFLRSGATPEKVAKILGHADPATLLKYYARFCSDDLIDVVDTHAKASG